MSYLEKLEEPECPARRRQAPGRSVCVCVCVKCVCMHGCAHAHV